MPDYYTDSLGYIKQAKRKPRSTLTGNKDVFLLPYNKFSQGAKALIKGLDLMYNSVQRLEETYVIHPNDTKVKTVINWGSGNFPGWLRAISTKVLNDTTAVNICRNKVKFFQTVGDKARIPEILYELEPALALVRDGKLVMGRKANGSCGTDIVFYEENASEFSKADFWSVYKKKKHEFRVHIFNGEIIDLQQKALRTTDPAGNPMPTNDIDFRIRNHRNGFIFKRNEISVPNDVTVQALAAFKAIPGLDFGAVDVIYNEYEDKAYVLEINTAPGLEGTTLENYLKAFKTI
jgi:hypothetical protein